MKDVHSRWFDQIWILYTLDTLFFNPLTYAIAMSKHHKSFQGLSLIFFMD